MRALILSDIHANLEALNAVLDAAGDRFDTTWNLGDTVGYGGSPNQVVDRVRPISSLTVRGNHDRVCCGLSSAVNFNPVARAAVTWTRSELTESNLTWLRELPQGPLHPHDRARALQQVLLAAGSSATADDEAPHSTEPDLDPTALLPAVALAHGSPLDEDHYILNMRDAWAPLQQSPAPITFIGHTHLQGGFALDGDGPAAQWNELRPRFHTRTEGETWSLKLLAGKRHLINPGSVGQPRDGDWRAACAIYNTDAAEITFFRVPYDVTAAQGHILMAGLPERLAARLREGR